MSSPTPLAKQGGYWRTSWYDATGKRRWKSFGSIRDVKPADAKLAYQVFLHQWHELGLAWNIAREPLTVGCLVEKYLKWADTYYRRPDGTQTGETVNLKHATDMLTEWYGGFAAEKMTPFEIDRVRERMIERDLCRNVINQRVRKIRGMFKWAVREVMISAETWHRLESVLPLKYGRSGARESGKVKPVPVTDIEKTAQYLPKPVLAIIHLLRLTGMRPTEGCIMRACDLDTSKSPWEYRPERHNTQHHGHERVIYLGPQAQAIVQLFLRPDLRAYLFKSTHPKAKQPRYNRNSVLLAIRRAAKRAGIPPWSPG
jgi:integrase